MKDIVAKVDRVKAIIAASNDPKRKARGPTEAELTELADIGIDVLGELVANSRRIAVALEAIAIAKAGPVITGD